MIMAEVLTEISNLKCAHGGSVKLQHSQGLLTLDGILALVKPDLLGRSISACPNATPSTPPCTLTVAVDETPAYSSFVTVEGMPICKSTATGRTNWSLLGIVPFGVANPNQTLVSVSE